MTDQAVSSPPKQTSLNGYYISLRVRLQILFILLLVLSFAAAFFWFSDFATNLAFERLQNDLLAIAETTAAEISTNVGDEYLALYEEYEPDFADGAELRREEWLENDVYLSINESLRRAKWNNPQKASGTYTYTLDEETNQLDFVVSGSVRDMTSLTERDNTVAELRLPGCEIPGGRLPIGIEFTTENDFPQVFNNAARRGIEGTYVMDTIYTDALGTWLSAFAPIRNGQGSVVGAVGIDACAADIAQIERDIREQLLIALAIAFIIIMGIVTFVAYGITRPIRALTGVAERIGRGNYDQDLGPLADKTFGDEVSRLAGVFQIMVGLVAQREESLKQKVASLQIIIDQNKLTDQVTEITENEFFSDLRGKAESMRRGRGTAATPTQPTPPDDKGNE